ncbi:MAG: hypothetical protein ACHQ2Z_06020 [Elusimicrobiota bacterium]
MIGFLVLLCDLSAAAPKKSHGPPPLSIEDDTAYQTGIKQYARGRRDLALGSFRLALRRHPGNRLALTTIRRVEGELGAAPAVDFSPEEPTASWLDSASASFDEFVLVDIPRAVNFNESVGDDVSDVGTLEALNGRVAQLMKERECAWRHGRRFSKDQEMRCLLRRIPAIAA